ncbi:MAG TPA: SAM-dependent methyltransferase, partial [Cellvibrionaceae bacterium]
MTDSTQITASTTRGTLYVVATPIGNLDDMTPRAVAILQRVARIACEDTRHSGRLLSHFAITTPLLAYHDHSDEQRTGQILSWLQSGEDIALISDAGTPLISDPGYRLVREARAQGLTVV